MREVIRLALETHDQVVIDTAPLLAVSDTLFYRAGCAHHLPGGAAEKTPRRMIRRAVRVLEENRPAAPRRRDIKTRLTPGPRPITITITMR